ncbi:MAG: IgGFc-binding protein, partial [Paraglaciecola sp.]|nr:IgGFc-binding protein [Paraglaciecola sp.]
SWTPSSSQIGINSAQLRVSNAAGEDIQIFDIDVSKPISEDMINFYVNPTIIYGNDGEDFNIGTVTIEGGGATINLVGNRWRAINFPYVITLNTVIEFDFVSTIQGEIHGIGFDADLTLNEENNFNLFGSQIYGIQDFIYTDIGELQHFVIPVGEYYTGAMNYLFFAMAHDVTNPSADSIFSNIQVYEKEVLFPVSITFNANLGPKTVAAEAPFSATATLISGDISEIEKIEFSLDLITWSPSTQINQTFTSEQLGPVEGGEHTLYVKVNSGAIQPVNFSADYRYYFLNPDWVGQSVNLVGLEDNTSLMLNGELRTINKGQTISYIVNTQGEFVTADKPFAAGTDADGLDMPVPANFSGTQFAIPNIRYTHFYYLLSPYVDTQVQIKRGQDTYNITLTAGEVHTFNAGSATKVGGSIHADVPILVSHSTNLNRDAYPVQPAAKELWGIRSQWAYVAALEDNTQITVHSDNGASQSFTLNTGGIKEITIGLNTKHGQGSALHILANKPVAAIQHADDDGYETTTFGSVDMFSTDYILPLKSQYVAIVCTTDTFITLLDSTNNNIANTSCLADNTAPGKAYFGEETGLLNIDEGYQIQASNPIYLIYEAKNSDDEHNLLGNKAEIPIIQLGYIANNDNLNIYTSDTFIATATIYDNRTIGTLEFSLNGKNWYPANLINSTYQFNFGTLPSGNYTLYAKSNDERVHILRFEVAPSLVENSYYFLNPEWIGKTVKLVGLENNTTLTVDGIAQTLNKGQTISYIVNTQGEFVTADKPFAAGTDADGLDMPVPANFSGTQFAIPNIRYTHFYYLLSPYVDTQVQIKRGQDTYNITLTAGEVHTFNAGSATKVGGSIHADVPILVSHSTNLNRDAYPVQPAAKELWGIRSQWAYVAALEDNTQITVHSDNGASQSFTLNTGGIKEITIGLNTKHGQGSALHILANKPVAAIQHADDDGYETTTFGSVDMFSTDYILPLKSQYVAIVCTTDTFITLLDSTNNNIANTSCLADNTAPGKAYFGEETGLLNIDEGYQIQASNPIYLIYEAKNSDDEHNLLGL